MQIRKSQHEVLRQSTMADFERRAVAHLRQHVSGPTSGQPDDALKGRVRSCIPRAARYGLTSERQVISFVDATYLLGEEFDTQPGHRDVAELLSDPDLSPDHKAGVLLGIAYGRHHRDEFQR